MHAGRAGFACDPGSRDRNCRWSEIGRDPPRWTRSAPDASAPQLGDLRAPIAFIIPDGAAIGMKTQYYVASSLDGFIADPEHSLAWLLQFGDLDETSYPDFVAQIGAIAMGSRTYEWLLEHLVRPDSEAPEPWPYTQPAWVFTSRDLPTLPGAELHFVAGDVRPVHAAMSAAAGGKNLWIAGGGELAGHFYDAALLDELIVQIAPVMLGTGTPLLPRAITEPPLERIAVDSFGPFVELRYRIPRD